MGVKNLRVSNVCDDGCIGFEIANDVFQTTPLENVLSSKEAETAKGALPISLGVKIDGTPVFADLAKMPHLLVAGATGSGKSVGLNAFIISLIKKHKPSELKFVMID
ncbi:MAG: cell division protein FtsK, partial [Alphaproteobacteria bacterium]|nr:cell division protein FtsK [Alphaproteobacteria bacterium]